MGNPTQTVLATVRQLGTKRGKWDLVYEPKIYIYYDTVYYVNACFTCFAEGIILCSLHHHEFGWTEYVAEKHRIWRFNILSSINIYCQKP